MTLEQLAQEIAEANFVLGMYHAFKAYGWPWVSKHPSRLFWESAGQAANRRVTVHDYPDHKTKILIHNAYNDGMAS